MPTRVVDVHRPTAIPVELGGKWIAWNAEHTCVVAQADSLDQLWELIHEQNIVDPVFEKVPRADVRFVGMR